MNGTNTRASALPEEAALALWHQYRTSGDARLRDRLVLTYAPLVKYIAYKKIRDYPAQVEVDELISCGLEGLIQAIDRYDPAKGASLHQYAWTRIQGAMLDELRRLDWAPRSLRAWQRDLTAAKKRLAHTHARPPKETELAAAIGVAPTQLRRLEREIDQTNVSSLNIPAADEDGERELIDLIADDASDAEQALVSREAKQRLHAAIDHLPDKERTVIALLYGERWTLREIGHKLGVSESRACQLHTSAKARLRRLLEDHRTLLLAA